MSNELEVNSDDLRAAGAEGEAVAGSLADTAAAGPTELGISKMKPLLEFYIGYFDFLYQDSRYRFTDSSTDGTNASLTVTGPDLTWLIAMEKGQPQLSISPTRLPEQGYWISLIRQYIYGNDDIHYLPANEEIEWARANIRDIEELVSDTSNLEGTCNKLQSLLRSNAEKEWGPAAGD